MEEVIRVEDLRKWFPVRMGLLKRLLLAPQLYVRAVDGISFEIRKGEIFGLVGESGSGKTTTGRLIVRLLDPTSGKILFHGKDITYLSEKELKPFRRKLQIVFQDPYESLNPRKTIFDSVAEPLEVQGLAHGKELEDRVKKALESVELIPAEEFMGRYPHELSGGQRQRAALARALVVQPEFIVADEPVSMLDVSIRAEVLNIMINLAENYGVSFLYITHDLALAKHVCDNIAVMYLGEIVEKGPSEKLIDNALHPYTQALRAAVPVPDPTSRRTEVVIKGEIPSPINPPPGCRFHTRCPQYIGDICETKRPELIYLERDHCVACHLYSKK